MFENVFLTINSIMKVFCKNMMIGFNFRFASNSCPCV